MPLKVVPGPYLETHPLRRLSDGGRDHPKHVVALCPPGLPARAGTCHRQAHHSSGAEPFNLRLQLAIARNEDEL